MGEADEPGVVLGGGSGESTVAVSVTRVSGPQDFGEDVERPELAAGVVVGGSFEILGVLGRGGMGAVYRARDLELEREIALKVAKSGGSERRTARLLREARAMAKLSHPNVITVHAVGVFEGQVYIAMELVEGGTATQWAEDHEGDVEAILALYLQAAEGLAAAHEKGLVHRDFKPDNVLVGNDGRARVADFGIAQAEADETKSLDDVTRSRLDELTGSADSKLTTTGAMLGTPAYMAPEQYLGEGVDARADQFAFCVALWEALYGERPFPGRKPAELMINIGEGNTRDVPADAPDVPSKVHQALLRGLQADQTKRFPSMRGLVRALRVDRGKRMRLLALGAVAFGALGLGVAMSGGFDRVQPCANLSDPVDELWNDERAKSIASRFEASALPHAEATWKRSEPALKAWADAWTAEREAACAATHEAQTQTMLARAQRDECLDRTLVGFEALLQRLDQDELPDALVDQALDAVEGLPRPETCADVERLAAKPPPPADPEQAEEARAIEAEFERFDVAALASDFDEAQRLLEALTPRVEALDHGPLRARLSLGRAQLARDRGALDEMRSGFETAYFDARAAGSAEHSYEASRQLAHYIGFIDHDEKVGSLWVRLAEAELARIPRPTPAMQIGALTAAAAVDQGAGRTKESLEKFRAAKQIAEREHGADSIAVGRIHNQIGTALDMQARYGEALEHYEAALALYEQHYGENHPELINLLSNMGLNYTDTGDTDKGTAFAERALLIGEGIYPPDHERIGTLVTNHGVALHRAGKVDEAVAAFERSLDIAVATLGEHHPDVARRYSNVGVIRQDQKRLDEAEAAHRKAVEVAVTSIGEGHPDTALYMNNHASTLVALERYDEAITLYEKSLAISEAALEPGHVQISLPLFGIGMLERSRERWAASLTWLERALVIRRESEADPALLADAALALARSLRELDRDPKRAQELAREAREAFLNAEKSEDAGDVADEFDLEG